MKTLVPVLFPKSLFTALALLLLAAPLTFLAPAEAADLAPTPAATEPASTLSDSSRTALPSGADAPRAAQKTREKTEHEKLMELLGLGLGCVGTVMGIGIAFFAIWIDYRKRHRLMEIYHQERMIALEKGLELPPFPAEFCWSDIAPKPSTPGTGLKAGLIWLGIGIGMVFLPSRQAADGFHTFGGIPIAVGLAYLIFYALEGRKRAKLHDSPTPTVSN